MSSEGQEAPASSQTEGEPPVRARLSKTSIDNTDTSAEIKSTTEDATQSSKVSAPVVSSEKTTASAETVKEPSTSTTRGRPVRKRSFDEAQGPVHSSSAAESRQGRKRSRDNSPEDDDAPVAANSSARTSGESAREAAKADEGSEDTAAAETGATANGLQSSPRSKRSRVGDKGKEDEGEAVEAGAAATEGEKATNGSKAASAAAETTESKTELTVGKEAQTKSAAAPQTSSSAFASSGFGSFASAPSSGFGALGGPTKLSSFASSATETKPDDPAKLKGSTFGGALGQTSAFGGGGGSAFGGLSSGFGSGFGSGGGGFSSAFGGVSGSKLSSFASATAPSTTAPKKPARAFGAPVEADEEGSDNEDEEDGAAKVKSPEADTEEKQDQRFYKQDLETGEENEETEYTCRAKLYNFVSTNPSDAAAKKEWKERGLGTLRLNVQTSSSTEPTETDLEAGGEGATGRAARARLVMRADGSHRVILNTPIKRELQFGTVTGEAPQGGYVYFMGSIDGKPKLELLQLKMRQQFATELYEHIQALKEDM